MKHVDKEYIKTRVCRNCSDIYVLSNSNQKNCNTCLDTHGKDRLNWIHKKYKITTGEFDTMLVKQGKSCGICSVLFGRGESEACIDHCHNTNKVRGLLCRKCNRAIGQLGDNEQGIIKVLEYLRGS